MKSINKETPNKINTDKSSDSKDILKLDQDSLKTHVNGLVLETVEQTLNGLLESEADVLCSASKHERSADRTVYRSGNYHRKLETQAGEVTLKVPKLKGATFETQIIERYRRRESSVEESLVQMYLAGVSVRKSRRYYRSSVGHPSESFYG